VTSEVIEACKNLKIVAVHGVGVDRVDVEAATKRDIVVTNVPLANIDAVAEHTFGLILSVFKNIPMLSTLVKDGKWLQSRSIANGREVLNHTIGVVGLGHVGQKVKNR
jgi:D-3-phosphoglycerate dehydrogenase